MTIRRAAIFVLNHKAFLFGYILYSLAALFVLLCAVVIAQFSARPEYQTPISRFLWRFTRAVNYERPANLTPQQCGELKRLLDALPTDVVAQTNTKQFAEYRRQSVLGYRNFVFSRFEHLPLQAQEDWKTLNEFRFSDSVSYDDGAGKQQRFLLKTLTVRDVQSLLNDREKYNILKAQIEKSSALIDRLMPALLAQGLNRTEMQSTGMSFQEYISQNTAYMGSWYVYELPEVNFTLDDVIRQLDKPPLSDGHLPAARGQK